MAGKKQIIIEQAIEILSRYGVRRTTMGDIADHAGVSRQTLYTHFSNKDEVLRAAICHVGATTIQQISEAWEEHGSISSKLDAYFDFAVICHFEAIAQMPDSNDLLTGYSNKGTQELRRLDKQKIKLLENEFEQYKSALVESGSSPAGLAEFVEITASNFKYVARDKPQLLRLLRSLKTSTMMMLGEA